MKGTHQLQLISLCIVFYKIACLDVKLNFEWTWSRQHDFPGNKPFVAVWNVPSGSECKNDLDLAKFDIIANDDQAFVGDEMVIFYGGPGTYPMYFPNGTAINGGLPQNVNITKHLQKVTSDIRQYIPDEQFSGMAVIDWEAWVPIFDRNLYTTSHQHYIKQSEKKVKIEHPSWTDKEVESEARREFEAAAKLLIEATLVKVRQLRPLGKWGLYGFPHCYNYRVGERYCANDTQADNNRLDWLFSSSSAVYPSIYLSKNDPPTSQERAILVSGIVREAMRLRDKFSDRSTHVYAYTRFRYRDVETEFYSQEDLINTIVQSMNAGLDGVVLWESSSFFREKSACSVLQDYIDIYLGPVVKTCSDFAGACSQQWCSNHGKCVNKHWHVQYTLETFARDIRNKKDFSNYICRCSVGWTGDHCDHV